MSPSQAVPKIVIGSDADEEDVNPELHRVDTATSSSAARKASTPAQYIARIVRHSERPKEHFLYSGLNYRHFAQFINSSTKSQVNSNNATQSRPFPFAFLHRFGPHGARTLREFDAIDGLSDFLKTAGPPEEGFQVIFLRGWASPDWLSAVGSLHRLDPEYSRRHLDFLQTTNFYDSRPLPSTSSTILQLHYTTICTRPAFNDLLNVQQARQDEHETVRRHCQRLCDNSGVGESIIRRLRVHDETTFTIEQTISICMKGKKRRGWTAFVWLDTGKELDQGPPGPWTVKSPQTSFQKVTCNPVIQHRPKLALERTRSDSVLPDARGMVQSIAHLPSQYGLNLDIDLATQDVCYALSEVFTLAANSKRQSFNLFESQFEKSMSATGSDLKGSIADLKHIKACVDEDKEHLSDVLRWLKNSTHTASLSADASESTTISQCRQSLTDDYDHLLCRASAISGKCLDGVNMVTNEAMHREAMKNIVQTEKMKRLTLLAFLYLPLSFTTSLFGMNLAQFGTGNIAMWVFFATLIPISGITLVVCLWNEIPRTPRKATTATKLQQFDP